MFLYSRALNFIISDLNLTQLNQAKNESIFGLYIQSWLSADYFLLEPMKKEDSFGRRVFFRYLRTRETPNIGAPADIPSLCQKALMDPKCRHCMEPEKRAKKCFHDSDDVKKDAGDAHLILWTCDKCVLIRGYP